MPPAIKQQQNQEGADQHAARQPVGAGVVHGLDVVEDLHRDYPRALRDIAANHQYHPKLSECVGKTEHTGGDNAWTGQWQRDGEEAIQRAGAKGGGHFHRTFADGLEGVLNRLHHKGHGVADRANHQAAETERQGAEPELLGQRTNGPVRTERDQQIEAQHRWWQHQRQCNERTDRAF